MKRKLVLLLLLISALITCATSCRVSDVDENTDSQGSSDGSGQNNDSADSGSADTGNGQQSFIYENGSELSIVYTDPRLSELAEALKSRITNYSTVTVRLVGDSEPEAEHEIILGECSRTLSKKAYRRLSRMAKAKEEYTSYTVYTDGSSVAVAFEDDFYGSAMADSLEYVTKTLVPKESSLTLSAGVVKEAQYDPLDKVRAQDEKDLGTRFASLCEEITELYGKEHAEAVVAALRDYYALYSENLVLWFANLYDPAVGGFYYSNSARNTLGFLPDVESTTQALNFIVGSGMANGVGGSYANVLPSWMRDQIVYFVKGLQDENGFFYHPQWGKELTDVHISRRARDLVWATGILSNLGATPVYDTPSGVKGETASPVSFDLTLRLASGVSLCAAKAVSASSTATVPAHLKTKEAFLEYLNSFDMKNDSYFAGNELGSQSSQFIERDAQLKKEGAGWRASEIVIDFLNSKQIPETGTWHYERNYMGVNGLLKISGLYNSLGAKMNYPLVAAESAIMAITTDEEPLTICYAYNAWFSVTNIQENLRKYSEDPEKGAEEAAALSAQLMEFAPEAIRATKEKYLKFIKFDGSFSYNQTSSAANAQGMAVAVPGTNEGDVNATEIGTAGVLGHMYGALGLKKIPFFGNSHRLLYLYTLNGLGAVIKDVENTDINYVTYDNDAVGKAPGDVTAKINSSGTLTVEADEGGKKDDRILKLESVSDGGDTLIYACDSLRADAKCFVFETDISVDSIDNSGNVIQIYLGNKAYMLNLKIENRRLRISDVSSGSNPRIENDFGVELGLGEWFNLKAEYYPADEGNVRAKVYVNGELVGVTDNYYDSSAARLNGKTGKPNQHYTEASVYVMSYHNVTLLLDNTACYKTSTPFKAVTALDKQPHVNIDDEKNILGPADPDTGNGAYYNNEEITEAQRLHYGMMGYPMPSLSGSLYAGTSVEGGMLVFKRTAEAGTGESYLSYRLTPPTAYEGTPCTVLEFDYRFSGGDISSDNAPFRFDDGNYIRFVKNSDGVTYSLGTKDTAAIAAGEWTNIAFEIYYLGEFCEYAKIFVDGEYTATVRFVNMSPFNERLLVYIKKNMAKDTEINIDNFFFWHTEKDYIPESAEFSAPDISLDYTDAPALGEYFNGEAPEGSFRQDYSDGTTPSLSGSAAMVLSKNESALLMKIADGEGYISYSLTPSITAEHAASVFEFDFKMSGLDPTHDNAPFRLDGGDHIRFVKNSDGKSWSLVEKDTAEIVNGEWYNIRFEIYFLGDSEIAKIFVDGEHTATLTLATAEAFNTRLLVYMKLGAARDAAIFIDNMLIAHLDKEYVPPVTPPDEGGGEGGNESGEGNNPEGGDQGGNEGGEGSNPEGGDQGGSGGNTDEGGEGSLGGGAIGDTVDGDTLLGGSDMAGDGWTTPTAH